MDSSAWELLLPAGILEYFEVTGVENDKKGYTIFLVEKDLKPDEYKNRSLSFHGWMDEITLKDFPIRNKACFLVVKRRRWLDEDTRKTETRNWELVAKGTRLTQEFATFLKGVYR